MSKLVVEIEIGNEATLLGEDLAELVRRVACQIEKWDAGRAIFDRNGNRVGKWGYVND